MSTTTIESGQTKSGWTISSGSRNGRPNQTVSSATVKDGGTIVDFTAISGGAITISSGGLASGTIIRNGGNLTVSNGGVTRKDQVSAGGVQTVLNGGVASTTYVGSGASLFVSSGGLTSNTIITDSTSQEVVYASGVARNADVYHGGGQTISSGGVGSNTTLYDANGFIFTGGSAVHFDVKSGSHLYVTSGAFASHTNISSGGTEILSRGAYSLSGAVSSGGRLVLQSGATMTGARLLVGGTIDLDSVSYGKNVSASITSSMLNVYSAGKTVYQTQLTGDYDGYQVATSSDTDGSTDLTLTACFLAGTMIRTPEGEVAVETLSIGDVVETYDWRTEATVTRRLTWVGRQMNQLRPDQHDDEAGYPVRIARDAIAPGVPAKDLLVTPEHCMFFNGGFIPARMLVNGSSIAYDRTQTRFAVYHVETEEHAILWADGALSESYLDTGNRAGFAQDGTIATLARRELSWDLDAAAPLSTSREAVEPVFLALQARAASSERTPELTTDADIRLLTDDGQVIRSHRQAGRQAVFAIPAHVNSVRLLSRHSRPCDTVGPFVDDRRSLGVLVGQVTFFAAEQTCHLTQHLSDVDLNGWHGLEAGGCRWTTGDAVMPLENTADGGVLSLEILQSGPYLASDQRDIDMARAVG